MARIPFIEVSEKGLSLNCCRFVDYEHPGHEAAVNLTGRTLQRGEIIHGRRVEQRGIWPVEPFDNFWLEKPIDAMSTDELISIARRA